MFQGGLKLRNRARMHFVEVELIDKEKATV